MTEMFERRARVLVGCHAGKEGIAVGRQDPRVLAHPQPGHALWEVFLFFDRDWKGEPVTYTGHPDDDGYGFGYEAKEVQFL